METAEKTRTYLCIDMKCFYASVECAKLGLNPFETNLVVADESRGKNALCLAISPKMKSLGVKNRCRLSEIPPTIQYRIAKPHMRDYELCSADIHEIYLQYIDSQDIHPYSIDESFIDATDYLTIYKKTPKQFAKFLIDQIAEQKHIPATAGIGTNLYLAKIALDITAKHSPDHMGYLTEELYRETLWKHKDITDFWQIADGKARRLARYGLYTMYDIAHAPEELILKEFGIDGQLMIDHAWGRESCTISDIKNHKSQSKSVSSSQILMKDYDCVMAKHVLLEMTLNGCQEMMRRNVITQHIGIFVGYSRDMLPCSKGTVRMLETTSNYSIISKYVSDLYDSITDKNTPIRRLGVVFQDVCDKSCEGYTLFTNFEQVEKEQKLEKAVLILKDKFGKNAMLRASDLEEGSTQIERNKMIGGHNA